MQYTLVLGAPVVANGKTLGKIKRIIVQYGVANQFTVDPGLLGYERVLPISDARSATADGVELNVSDDQWKAYPAFNIEDMVPESDESTDPGLAELTPQHPAAAAHRPDAGVATTSVDVPPDDVTVHEQSAVLSSNTRIVDANGNRHALHGLVLDTGRPVQALVEGAQPIDLSNLRSLTAEEIRL